MKKLAVRAAAAVLITAVLTVSNIFAVDFVKRVVFPKGKNTVIYKNKLPGQYADYHAYTLRAKKGQRITVKLTTDDADASFSVFETKELGPDEDMIFGNQHDVRMWSGKAPITSEYSIQIYGVKDIDDKPSGASYSIEITLLN